MPRSVLRQEVLCRKFESLTLEYEPEQQALWCRMHAHPRACFTPSLLTETRQVQDSIRNWRENSANPLSYVVLASAIPNVFNRGGDLECFEHWIATRDHIALTGYANMCVEVCYHNAVNYGQKDLSTIALVQGDALGGGFEAAMSATILVAERQSTFGLPEILFNLFPGMGAFTLLARRVGARRAEQIIRNGQIYTAEQMHEEGIVDILVETGDGENAVRSLIKSRKRSQKGNHAIDRAKLVSSPVDFKEMRDIVEIWVDTALALDEKDLRVMRRLVNRQHRAFKEPVLLKGNKNERRDSQSPGSVFRNTLLPIEDHSKSDSH